MESYTTADPQPSLTPRQKSLAATALKATGRHELAEGLEGINGGEVPGYAMNRIINVLKELVKGDVGYPEARFFLDSIDKRDDAMLSYRNGE